MQILPAVPWGTVATASSLGRLGMNSRLALVLTVVDATVRQIAGDVRKDVRVLPVLEVELAV